jgi:PIN domain nuclease of toxin-antitoxin system
VSYVADTHVLLLFASGDLARASRRALKVLRRAAAGRERVHVPTVCFFELGLLLERRRVRSPFSFDEWHDLVAAQPGFVIEPLGWEDVREARALVGLVDPFDRLIAGTAVRLEAPLLTGDERIRRSALVPTVW